MHYVLHCGGMPFNGATLNERSLGGSETAAYYVARELVALGHRVSLFTNTDIKGEGIFDGVKYLSAGPITEQEPLGRRFHFYMENTPTDVLIIQRHPQAFRYNWQAKIKLWWLHDLAIGRVADMVATHLWNLQGVLTVSKWHKNQVHEVWGASKDRIFPIQNGVDLGIYNNDAPIDGTGLSSDGTQVRLLYAARPERGLENLLKPGGIMDQLRTKLPEAHLYHCTYDNQVSQLSPFYARLEEYAKSLPNVTKLPALTKQQLADVERLCDLYVYPTTFEDTSCIMAMECMAAGLPFLGTNSGALPETCKDSGSLLLPLGKERELDLGVFTDKIVELCRDKQRLQSLRQKQLVAAPRFAWEKAAEMIEEAVDSISRDRVWSTGTRLRNLIRSSDIYMAEAVSNEVSLDLTNPITQRCCDELEECYEFAWNGNWREHYARYYEYERARGVEYGPETLDGNSRFEHVAHLVGNQLRAHAGVVVDYGCAHGHYTVNLAKRFPEHTFVGIDLVQSNIDTARKWAADEKLTNVKFIRGEVVSSDERGARLDLIDDTEGAAALIASPSVVLLAEVLEHVEEPAGYVHALAKPNTLVITTTPYGPWEALGYRQHHPWRAHVHHFNRADLYAMFGQCEKFTVACVPVNKTERGEGLGSFITSFVYDEDRVKPYAVWLYNHKAAEDVPSERQTVSTCMIVHNAEDTLLKTLRSIRDVSDEVIICVDEKTTDGTERVAQAFKEECNKTLWPVVSVKKIKSPLETGFDTARNESIGGASGDWVLWIDADEVLVNAHNLFKYLQDSPYMGFAIKQHHFAVEPLGVLRTDLPCRVFRNHRDARFFGLVHEHPEVKLNEGVGAVLALPDVAISHHSYTTEDIRLSKFVRNFDLMERDREAYPDRILGKFLWFRDCAQLITFKLRENGGRVTVGMQAQATKALALWDELLVADYHTRFYEDAVEYYSVFVKVLGEGFNARIGVDACDRAEHLNGDGHIIEATFRNHADMEKLFSLFARAKTKKFENKYY